MRTKCFFIILFCVPFELWGQRVDIPSSTKVQSNQLLTGSLLIDLCNIDLKDSIQSSIQNEFHRYSPSRAALMSAVVPGAGQFYTKSYLQSALFFGFEVGMWILYSQYTSKGDDKTKEFEHFADEHWSVVRYARWMAQYYPEQFDPATLLNNPSDNVEHPWDYVNWDKLNSTEDAIGQLILTSQPTGFTHRLPRRPEQQYYELIGKYSQYGGGWDDAAYYTPDDVLSSNVSPHFHHYSAMRGDANDLYAVASTATYLLVANHVFNALEAAWNATRMNRKLSTHASFQIKQYGSVIAFEQRFTTSIELGK